MKLEEAIRMVVEASHSGSLGNVELCVRFGPEDTGDRPLTYRIDSARYVDNGVQGLIFNLGDSISIFDEPEEHPLKDKWKEAEETGQPVDVGNKVVCDYCSKDYTKLDDSGGFIFTSSAVCPECAPKQEETIKGYKEEHYIHGRCKPGQSFADFVREYRGDNTFIQISQINQEEL